MNPDNTTCPPVSDTPADACADVRVTWFGGAPVAVFTHGDVTIERDPLEVRLCEMFDLDSSATDDDIEAAIRALVTRAGVDDLVESRTHLRAVLRDIEDQLDDADGPRDEVPVELRLRELLEALEDGLDAAGAPPHRRLTQRLHLLGLELEQLRLTRMDVQLAFSGGWRDLDAATRSEGEANRRGDEVSRRAWHAAWTRAALDQQLGRDAIRLGGALGMTPGETMGIGPMIDLAVDALRRARRVGFDVGAVFIRPSLASAGAWNIFGPELEAVDIPDDKVAGVWSSFVERLRRKQAERRS